LRLATYEDICSNFLLLDPRDAPAVFDFLQGQHSGKQNSEKDWIVGILYPNLER
jgi:hypothetical protein